MVLNDYHIQICIFIIIVPFSDEKKKLILYAFSLFLTIKINFFPLFIFLQTPDWNLVHAFLLFVCLAYEQGNSAE